MHLQRQGSSEAGKVSNVFSPECNIGIAHVGLQVVKLFVEKCRSVFFESTQLMFRPVLIAIVVHGAYNAIVTLAGIAGFEF